ncbi:hypothetical protein BW730_00205 [Tessaracoccus aquimaris]|uniref:Uncharacterized protein n=2 Tax=Tessaracoccus aquimaris TaxID=1332264 RepID=A0A1Q2CJK4_9ACTN|nr:hypothetical protein BW730_00205 [Tessaracoccus aquimaris]
MWVISDEEEIDRLRGRFRGVERVTFVHRGSIEYLEGLATAGHIIQNTSYPSFFSKRNGQVCVDTWHSTSVKKLGFDMPGGNIHSRNMIRSLLISDFVLSPNPFMTRIFRDSYRLQNLYQGKILEVGYPRNDSTLRGLFPIEGVGRGSGVAAG